MNINLRRGTEINDVFVPKNALIVEYPSQYVMKHGDLTFRCRKGCIDEC